MNCNLLIFYSIGIFSVIGVSVFANYNSLGNNIRSFSYFTYLLIALSIYMLFEQIFKFNTLHFYVDFSHWIQIFNTIAITGRPESLNEELLQPGSLNYFSAHFVPGVYVFALFFKIWPYSKTIIILNYLFMASSIIPLYKLSLLNNKNKQFGLFMSALLLWYPPFQYITTYEFEMLRFSIPIILWMLYFWEKKYLKPYFLFVILAVFVREEVGLTIILFGVYLFFMEKERRVGLATFMIGLVAFITITQLLMPFLKTGNYSHVAVGSFLAFGNSIPEIIVNVIIHPVKAIKIILDPIKMANIFMFLLPLLFIPLLAPKILICTLAFLAIGMLSAGYTHISYTLYYASPVIPFLFYAFIKGWPKSLRLLSLVSEKWLKNPGINLDLSAMAAVLLGLIVTNIFFGPSPVSLQFWFKELKPVPFRTRSYHYSVYEITDHHKKAGEFTKIIPDSAIVSAQHFFHPRLFNKRAAMIYPHMIESKDGLIKADYVLLDITNNGHRDDSPVSVNQKEIDRIAKDKTNWELIKSEDGFFLYRRINRPGADKPKVAEPQLKNNTTPSVPLY